MKNCIDHQAKVHFFRENGYLVINQAYSIEKIESFKKMLYLTLRSTLEKYRVDFSISDNLSLAEKCDAAILHLRESNAAYMSRVQSIVSRSPEYYDLCSSSLVMSWLRTLFGLSENSPIYLTNNGIIFTNPNDAENQSPSNIEIGWHKDTFFTIPRSQFLHVWAPILHDADEEIGTLQIFPKSHHAGLGRQCIHPYAQYDHRYSVPASEYSKYEPVSVDVKLGDALIFDGNLIHRSGKNISRHVRCTLIGLHHNALQQDLDPLIVEYKYNNLTPEGYYYELYKDDHALSLIHEQAVDQSAH